MADKIKVTVWNEYMDEQKKEAVAKAYPRGLHECIAGFLNAESDIEAKCSLITDTDQGLSEETLQATDVLVYWGHVHHRDLLDENVARLAAFVRRGMGAIFLHSSHESKPFQTLMGTTGWLQWREADEKCRVWKCNPVHPISAGLPDNFVLDMEEMYCEPFGIPEPEETVFISWFQGGNVFRSGVCYRRQYGKIFYFQPGHETYPNYKNPHVQQVIKNAVRWAKPLVRVGDLKCPHVEALEPIGK